MCARSVFAFFLLPLISLNTLSSSCITHGLNFEALYHRLKMSVCVSVCSCECEAAKNFLASSTANKQKQLIYFRRSHICTKSGGIYYWRYLLSGENSRRSDYWHTCVL